MVEPASQTHWLTTAREPTPWREIKFTPHKSARSLPPERPNDLLSAAYASNLESMITQYRPNLWVHGHTHAMNSYRVGATRVISRIRDSVKTEVRLEVRGMGVPGESSFGSFDAQVDLR